MRHFLPIFLAISAIALFGSLPLPVSAISDEQKTAISDNCPSIKQSLRSLQKADSRTRVYLGSIYQITLTDYITPLNLRLVKNNQPSADLTSIQADFTSARDDSAKKFITYSQSLEELILIDCSKNPEDFYDKLQDVRKKRTELSDSAAKVSKILNTHVDAVTKMKGELK